LLVFLGPVGWIALLILAGTRTGDEMLRVELPLSELAYQRLVAARRARRVSVGVAALATLALFARVVVSFGPLQGGGAWLTGLLLVVVVALVVQAVVASARLRAQQLTVGLDGSRRWVEISGVHPNFVEAVEAQQTRRDERRRV